MIRTIPLIQFHNHTEDTDDRDARSVVGKWFIMGEEDTSAEFFDGDDDNGDATYVDKDCVSYYDSFDDYFNEENTGYIVRRRLRYSIIEIDVECDEDTHEIKWIA